MTPHDSQIYATKGRGSSEGQSKNNDSYTPQSTFRGSVSAKIPPTATDGKDRNCTKPKDRLAGVSNKSNENGSVRTGQRGEVRVIHLIMLGVGCITALIVVALMKGVDGVLMSSGLAAIVALISGFSGYKIGQKSVIK